MERTGIEPVTSGLQIPGFEARLGQVRSVNAKLRWLREVEIGYSGTRFGTRFASRSQAVLGDRTLAQGRASAVGWCALMVGLERRSLGGCAASAWLWGARSL